MSIPRTLEHFLDHRIPYITERQDDAQGKAFAKPVLVNIDGKIAMAVIPAAESVDLHRLCRCLGADRVRLAWKSEYQQIFSDCDDGEMPIFGSAYGIPVLVPHEITDNEEIAFHAGTPRDVVRVRVRDFLVMEKPWVCPRKTILEKAS